MLFPLVIVLINTPSSISALSGEREQVTLLTLNLFKEDGRAVLLIRAWEAAVRVKLTDLRHPTNSCGGTARAGPLPTGLTLLPRA
jgi:hypothetical protein